MKSCTTENYIQNFKITEPFGVSYPEPATLGEQDE